MSLFQRIRDSVAKGYKSAEDSPSPSVGELHALRKRLESSSEGASPQTIQDRADKRQELSEIDSMISRAKNLQDRSNSTRVIPTPDDKKPLSVHVGVGLKNSTIQRDG